MATQAMPPQTQKPRREMMEVKAPEQYKFAKVGATLEGILISIEPTIVNDKPTREYMFKLENGDRITCLETADLAKKISPDQLGHFVTIRYESDDASFQKAGQSAMKRFKVTASKTPEQGYEHLKAS